MVQLVTAKPIRSQATQAQHKMANSLNFRRPLESHTPEKINKKVVTCKLILNNLLWFIVFAIKLVLVTKRINFKPFTVHYDKIRIHLCETATNSAKVH